MNLDRIRKRLNEAENATVFQQAIVIHDFAGVRPDPMPERFRNDIVAQPGESQVETLGRYGIQLRKGKPSPIVRLTLNWRRDRT